MEAVSFSNKMYVKWLMIRTVEQIVTVCIFVLYHQCFNIFIGYAQ
jgi:hypothetical protein